MSFNRKLIISLLCIWLINGLLIFLLTYSFKSAIIISTVFTLGFSLLFFTHKARSLKRESLEITSGNKDRDLPMQHYADEIESFFWQLGYYKEECGNFHQFIPRGRQKIMGGHIDYHYSHYEISIEGPRGVVRILCETLSSPGSSFEVKKTDSHL